MIRTLIMVLPALYMFFSAAPARAIDVPVKYKHIEFGEDDAVFAYKFKNLKKSLVPPPGDWKLPALKSEFPIYALIPLGEGSRLLVVDQRSGDDAFYNRIYFDANGNGDLTDDPVIIEDPEGGKDPAVPHPYTIKDVSIPQKSGQARYSFRINVNYVSRRKGKKPSKAVVERSLKLQIAASCLYEGKLELGGTAYRLCLGDMNGNGRFDDSVKVPDFSALPAGTKISLEGDGFYLSSRFEVNTEGVLAFGNWLVLEDRLFRVRLNLGAGMLTLIPPGEEMSTTAIPMRTEYLGIYTEDGAHYVMMHRPGKEVTLPPGRYRLDKYTALRKDDQGDEWVLAATATSESPCFSVAAEKPAKMDLGEPFHAYVSVPEWSRQSVSQGYSKQASLEFVIEGRGKEQVIELIRVSGERTRIPLSDEDRQRPREPGFKVVREGGELAFEGSFKYG